MNGRQRAAQEVIAQALSQDLRSAGPAIQEPNKHCIAFVPRPPSHGP